jgi:hypothetical protein
MKSAFLHGIVNLALRRCCLMRGDRLQARP